MSALGRKEEAAMELDPKDFIPFVVAILVAIGALFMIDAGNQGGGFLYGLGMAIFALAVLGGLWSIKRLFDRVEARRRR
jgi:lipopolysaccharide export LptBFGC system permease protein LptF